MPVYESDTDNALLVIESLTRHIAGEDGFDETTHPTANEVAAFESLSYYKILGMLASYGFDPIQTADPVLGILERLQVLETVILIELTQPVSSSGEPNERFKAFIAERDAIYELFSSKAIVLLGGITLTTPSTNAHATGVLYSEKYDAMLDPDVIKHRFRRGMFDKLDTRLYGQELRSDNP